MSDLRIHLETLFAGAPCGAQINARTLSEGGPARDYFAPLGEAEALVARLAQRPGSNVYVAVAPRRANDGSKAGIASIVTVHADLDGCERPDELRFVELGLPLPTMIVQSSPQGWHCYWALAAHIAPTPENVAWIEALNRHFARTLGGDLNACDASRILRPPATINWPSAKKKSAGRTPIAVALVSSGGPRYSLNELAAYLPAAPAAAPADQSAPVRREIEYRPDTIRAALAARAAQLDLGDRADYLRFSIEAKAAFGDAAQDPTDEILAEHPGYDRNQNAADWASLREDRAGGITDASLRFHLQQADSDEARAALAALSADEDRAAFAAAPAPDAEEPRGPLPLSADTASASPEIEDWAALPSAECAPLRDVVKRITSAETLRAAIKALHAQRLSAKAIEAAIRENVQGSRMLDKRADNFVAREVARIRAAARAGERGFATTPDGVTIIMSAENVRRGLALLGVSVRRNTFAERDEIEGLPGFDQLTDAVLNRVLVEFDLQFGFRPRVDFVVRVLADLAERNSYHPVRDYLAGLQWDGKPRLDSWLITYMAAEDSDYTRAVGALCLIAAVRRVRQPGCKFDEAPVLESPQGWGKSSGLAILAVRPEWFSDSLTFDLSGKEAVELTAGKWICEVAEMHGFRRADVNRLKGFMSRQADRGRAAFARFVSERPRQFVIFGTTNEGAYLEDRTGNRRFWPVRTGRIDLAALRADRDQLWAEAAFREAKGESIRLDPKMYAAATAEQDARSTVHEDPWLAELAVTLGIFSNHRINTGSVFDLLRISLDRRSSGDTRRVAAVMQALGWSPSRWTSNSTKQRGYQIGDGSREVTGFADDDTAGVVN